MLSKSTVEEIRARFDADVDRFSNLETGQAAQVDAPLMMELLTHAAVSATPDAMRMVDVGCGAGNYTLKLLEMLRVCRGHTAAEAAVPGGVEVTLIDLSRPMLDRAVQRIQQAFPQVRTLAVQSDVREFDFGDQQHDIVLAAQCLHHLRGDEEWERVFANVFQGLTSGGGFWVADSLDHEHPAIRQMMWDRWGEHLSAVKDDAYRDAVFAYVEKEDSPRPIAWQLELLRRSGFTGIDVLHVNSRFGCFGALRPLSADTKDV